MRVGALYAVLRLETGAFNAALTTSQTKFGAFMGVLKAGGFIVGQAIAVAAGYSLKAAADFETHMQQSLAIMGEVSDGIRQQMEDAARAVAKTSTFSATEAADAYYFLASAGYTAEQSISALPTVTQFAQAGVIDLEKATSLLMDTQTTMGLRTADAAQNMANMTRVSDVLTESAVESNASLEQMAEALLNKAGPALRVVGKDIEEGAAVLMVMANNGVKGKVAGTNLGIVLRELQTKALKNKEAFEAAGVAVYDANGEMRNMGDIVADLEGRLDGLTDAQKKQALLDLGFTDRSVGVIQSLLGTSDAIKKYEKQLRDAGGATDEVATKQLDTFQAQMTLAWHKIQDVAISIGQKLLPGARQIVEAFGNWIDQNHELITTIMVGIIGALGQLTGVIFGIVGGAFKAIGDVIAWITDESNGLIFAIRGVLTDTEIFSDEAGPLWEAVGETVQMVIHSIADGIAWFTEEVMPRLGEAFQWVIDEVLPPVVEFVQGMVDNILPIFAAAWSLLTDVILPKVGEAFLWILDNVLPPIQAAIVWFTTNILPGLQEAFGAVSSWITENMPLIRAIVEQVMGAISTAFQVAWNIAKAVVGTAVPIIWAIIEPIGRVLLPILGGAFSAFLEVVKFVFDAIGKIWQIFSDAAGIVAGAVKGAFKGIAGFFGGVWNGISSVFKGGLNFLVDAINSFLRFLNNLHIDLPEITIPGIDVTVGGGSIDPFNFGLIPRFARGVRGFSGGLALVGENGPELAYLPPGSNVYSNAETNQMLGGDVTVTVRDPDGALAKGGLSQKQLERAISEALSDLVGGARKRSLRVGSS